MMPLGPQAYQMKISRGAIFIRKNTGTARADEECGVDDYEGIAENVTVMASEGGEISPDRGYRYRRPRRAHPAG